MPTKTPKPASWQAPFLIGWLGPVGLIWCEALQSSQLYAPHRPSRSGEITQTWFGAKLWHRVQLKNTSTQSSVMTAKRSLRRVYAWRALANHSSILALSV